jgi:hypothetical protein
MYHIKHRARGTIDAMISAMYSDSLFSRPLLQMPSALGAGYR